MTGKNGGLDIMDEVVFLIFRDITLSVDKKMLKKKDPLFFSDSLGKRLKKMQEKGVALPTSDFSYTINGNKAIINGTIVITIDYFTPNGQTNTSFSAKAFLMNLSKLHKGKERKSAYGKSNIDKFIELENSLRGIEVEELNNSTKNKYGISSKINGVIVKTIEKDTPSYHELEREDIIIEVNRRQIKSIQDYMSTVSEIKQGDSVLLLVYRNAKTQFIVISDKK